MRKTTGILLTAAGLLAAGNSARAQAIMAPAGYAYSILSNVPATAVNPITYQWYRNNVPIQGATELSYTVPGALAYGENVKFYRMAKTMECQGEAEKPSNVITITFEGYTMPVGGCNLVVSGICWADYNINDLYTFASRADMYTKFYQWNRLTAYSADEPLTPAWNATVDTSTTWTVNPCPPNWRLPSQEEYQHLHNSGNSWVVENSGRGNIVPGRFYGYNHTQCKLPNQMEGCVFLPTSGSRSYVDGLLHSKGVIGYYWSSTQVNSGISYSISFYSTASEPANSVNKTYGFNIRCVR